MLLSSQCAYLCVFYETIVYSYNYVIRAISNALEANWSLLNHYCDGQLVSMFVTMCRVDTWNNKEEEEKREKL